MRRYSAHNTFHQKSLTERWRDFRQWRERIKHIFVLLEWDCVWDIFEDPLYYDRETEKIGTISAK